MPSNAIIETAEFQVNTFTSSSQHDSTVTALPDGGYIIVWASYGQDQDPNTYGVFGKRYDANGVDLSVDVQLNNYFFDSQFDPSITTLEGGGFAVSWTSNGQDASDSGVFGTVFNEFGAEITADVHISTETASYQEESSITGLAGGGFVVTWASYDATGFDWGVFGQIFDASGNAVGTEFQVDLDFQDDYSTTYVRLPEVTNLTDGSFIITWGSGHHTSGAEFGIYAQRYNTDGTTLGAEFLLREVDNISSLEPKITALSGGGFAVVWDDVGDVYASVFDASNVEIAGPFQVNTFTTSNQQNPAISGMADGGFLVTWDSFFQDGSAYGVYAQRYDANGETIGDEFAVNATTLGSQTDSSVTMLANGGYVVTWTSTLQDGDGHGVYAQQYAGQLFGTSDADALTDSVGANWMDGRGGADVLKGLKGNDVINGSNGADKLIGGAGNDNLNGGNGTDTLLGGAGADKLKGGAGADKLTGGAGKDALTGGGGADIFIFNDAGHSSNDANADVIKDFEIGIDKIDLSGLVAGLSFIGDSGFSGTGAEIRVIVNGAGKSLVRVDTDGDGNADMKIILNATSGLSVDDFIL